MAVRLYSECDAGGLEAPEESGSGGGPGVSVCHDLPSSPSTEFRPTEERNKHKIYIKDGGHTGIS